MSKEIYKEYVNKWIDEDDRLKKCELNDLYLFCGHPIRVDAKEDLLVIYYGFHRVTRKPKTQMINGHEVVAPRYDAPTNSGDVVCWVCPLEKDGLRCYDWESLVMTERDALMINGYYTSKEDVIAFIRALRDSKYD